ncbi:uncharacterized protein [Saccopteryx bilineata]|uniref:uncharacterized protein n=1 Tax=Saccopteryx bilineata TaxID=59482 RepID=UPI00338F0436
MGGAHLRARVCCVTTLSCGTLPVLGLCHTPAGGASLHNGRQASVPLTWGGCTPAPLLSSRYPPLPGLLPFAHRKALNSVGWDAVAQTLTLNTVGLKLPTSKRLCSECRGRTCLAGVQLPFAVIALSRANIRSDLGSSGATGWGFVPGAQDPYLSSKLISCHTSYRRMCDASGSDGHPRSVVSLTLLSMKAKHSLQSALSFPSHRGTESDSSRVLCLQPSEMNKERATYAELQLHHPKRQNKRHPTNKSREFTLQIIVIILGIICFFLLLSIIILGYMFFQISSEQKIRDMKDTSKNASSAEVEGHSNPSVSPPCPGKDSNPCQGKWSCCGKDCYFFSREEKTWNGSMKSCKDLGSSLIKIDSKEKQNFIQSKINYNFWVGLHRKGAAHKWLWLDNSPISQKLTFQQTMTDGNCGHIKPEAIVTAACSREFNFICEKQFSRLGN